MNATDRFKSALEHIIRRIASKYDYAIPWACKVVAQNSDGTLELVPDSPLLPGLSNVPIRYGAPGMKATVGAGARVVVEFENADPGKHVVTAWDLSSPLVMLTLGGGDQPAMRVGDLVQCGGPGQMCTITLVVPAAGTPAGLPAGSFITGFISFGSADAPPAPDISGASAQPIFGIGVTGSENVQA